MHLDLTEILRDPGLSLERAIRIEAGPLDEWQLTEPAVGRVRVHNARRNIVVQGTAKVAVSMECGRCLQTFSQPLDLVLDVSVPLATFNDQLGAAKVAEDLSDDGNELTRAEVEALFREHHLDVSELVRQAIVLSVPIQPLCRADCPGLPEIEAYVEKPLDPRWAALQLRVDEMKNVEHVLNGQTPLGDSGKE